MNEKPQLEELQGRIQEEISYYKGALPERVALVWHGYIAALLEWGLISVSDHERLCNLLPSIKDNPVVPIMLGEPGKFL
jgi:hypothetical protein